MKTYKALIESYAKSQSWDSFWHKVEAENIEEAKEVFISLCAMWDASYSQVQEVEDNYPGL